MPQKSDAAKCRRGWKAGLLGVFVCWQLFYLPAANLIQFVPLRVPAEPGDAPLNLQSVGRFTTDNRLQTLADAAGAGFARYSELSGQIQFWKLFSPAFPPSTIVLVTRIEFPDGRYEDVVSPYAPADEPALFRIPRRDVRPFQFEASVGLGPWAVTPELIAADPDAARQLTVEWVKVRSRAVRVTMMSHWHGYKADRPDSENPYRLTLSTRFIAKPGEGKTRSDGPIVVDRPLVRWDPPIWKRAYLSAFDPVDGKFVPIPEVFR